MPYYIGDVIKDAGRLIARTPEKFEETGVRVRLNTAVEEIDTAKGEVRVAGGERFPFDSLVLATGAVATLPQIPGVDTEGVFILKNLRDAITIKEYLSENRCRKVLVVGAGFIAMEICEALRTRNIDAEVIYRGELPVKRWDPDFSRLVLDELNAHGVSFVSGTTPLAVEKGAQYRLRLLTDGGPYEGDMILMALGVRPNTVLAEAVGIALGKSGAIGVDFSQQTSREGFYAAGDCCEVYHRVMQEWVNMPLGDIANKQGRVAGSSIGGAPRTFPGVVGAQSFKVFNLELALTGISERDAEKRGFDPLSVIIWGTPSARSLNIDKKRLGLKLIADRKSGRLIGAQAIGEAGAVSRVNVLSLGLWNGMTVDEIGYIDLAYSPPFSGAWDTIHIAAQKLAKAF